jgi:hypothetical protein
MTAGATRGDIKGADIGPYPRFVTEYVGTRSEYGSPSANDPGTSE